MSLLAGLGAGLLLPVQTTINTRLGRRAGSLFAGSFISFAVGTVTLALYVLALRAPVDGARLATQPWWVWIGGLCGVAFLTMNMLLMRALGASASVVLPIVGQVLGGVAIDAWGLFGAARVPLGPARSLGALAVAAGAVLVNLPGGRAPRVLLALPAPGIEGVAADPPRTAGGGPSMRMRLLLGALSLVTGSLSATQATVNGRLAQAGGSAPFAALVSFTVGTAALALILAVLRQRLPLRTIGRCEPWWIWAGGAMGAAFVLANAAIAPVLGTGLTVSVALLGQIVAGLAVDQFGMVGAPRRPLTPLRLLGALAVLGGVALVRVV